MARRTAAYAAFDKMNLTQLEQVRQRIDALLAEKRTESRNRLIETMKQEAHKQGFKLEDILGSTKKGKNSDVKYRHPKDRSLTWSGRGRPSKWLADLVAKGHNREEFAV